MALADWRAALGPTFGVRPLAPKDLAKFGPERPYGTASLLVSVSGDPRDYAVDPNVLPPALTNAATDAARIAILEAFAVRLARTEGAP